jgi:transcriptional regulator of acetoin/glycerol metabolism
MSKATIIVVSDDLDVVEKARQHWGNQAVNLLTYTTFQWREQLEDPTARTSLTGGVPSLVSGGTSDLPNNVVPFPGMNAPKDVVRVSTMEELESKAIENAIVQYRGNLTEAAKALGIGRATLYRKVKQFKIDPNSARKKRAA